MIKVVECVKCGYCCTVRPCAFGELDEGGNQCKFLTQDKLCSKYNEIISLPREMWVWNPAFGEGCCASLFNTVREEKIKKDKNEREKNNNNSSVHI